MKGLRLQMKRNAFLECLCSNAHNKVWWTLFPQQKPFAGKNRKNSLVNVLEFCSGFLVFHDNKFFSEVQFYLFFHE